MAKGGKRAGAGRPKAAEPSERIRVPISMVDRVKQFVITGGLTLPLYSSRVSAGQPLPSDDTLEDCIDLVNYLVDDPEETFMVYAAGDSMKDAGIRDGDLLLVNRKIPASHGRIVVAAYEGAVTVKYLIVKNRKAYLMPANPAFDEIPIDAEHGVVIWGVVTRSIQSH